jgi:hypothetical protein
MVPSSGCVFEFTGDAMDNLKNLTTLEIGKERKEQPHV